MPNDIMDNSRNIINGDEDDTIMVTRYSPQHLLHADLSRPDHDGLKIARRDVYVIDVPSLRHAHDSWDHVFEDVDMPTDTKNCLMIFLEE